jgi:magnesium transporter
VRERISQLRHDILHVRRVLTPTRDLARSVLDDRVDLPGRDLFPRDVEIHFADAYDKLLRATDGLDLSRDLLAGVRDYHQAQVANDQNEVMKRLTVVASVLLLPTFIVGLYGQNLKGVPELQWHYGYLWSWGLIVVTTAAQLVYFRRKRWI